MTTYFAKYLPVDGEIKEGDNPTAKNEHGYDLFYSIPENKIIGCSAVVGDTVWNHFKAYKKEDCRCIKLFICSNNFRKDSVVRTLKRPDIDYVVTEIFDMETVFIHSDLDITTSFAHPLTVFRPVGKVSSEATWVKDGDKFTAKQLFANGVGLNWNDSDRNLYFKVLGSCGHYH